jgi:hypothetical protein
MSPPACTANATQRPSNMVALNSAMAGGGGTSSDVRWPDARPYANPTAPPLVFMFTFPVQLYFPRAYLEPALRAAF